MVRINDTGIKFQFVLKFYTKYIYCGYEQMKKTSYILAATMMAVSGTAFGAFDNGDWLAEVKTGVDMVTAPIIAERTVDAAPGALGLEVYQTVDAVDTTDTQMYIPTTKYVRIGGGLNLGFATDSAMFDGTEYDASGSYTVQLGLGWNLSSYVRTELDFQMAEFKFSDLDDKFATYRTVGGMLYFDFARRYVQMGDITHRRTFVPFMGLGAAFGQYEFAGANGADGFVIAAPRAVLGFNVMFNDLIGLDIYYQYQMMIGRGFGWDVRAGGVDNISNIMAAFRVNF